ncbi:MAG TPA: DUF4166 domain-containing protein [Gemmataceae bacterium]|nr:DUF4166 domain-containing protein [Gemmataceae bacterium]
MPTVYQRVLRDRFELLHPTLRRLLGDERGGRAAGRLRVTRPTGWLRRLAGAALGLPPAGEYDILLVVTPHGDGQLWVRHFGKHILSTSQSDHRGLLVESAGPGSLGFDLVIEREGLFFRPRRAWILGVPVPLWLSPYVEADNVPSESGGWRITVRFRLPLLGPVGEYEGDVMIKEDVP